MGSANVAGNIERINKHAFPSCYNFWVFAGNVSMTGKPKRNCCTKVIFFQLSMRELNIYARRI